MTMQFEERLDFLVDAIAEMARNMETDKAAYHAASDVEARDAALRRIYAASASMRTAAFNLVRVTGERIQGLS